MLPKSNLSSRDVWILTITSPAGVTGHWPRLFQEFASVKKVNSWGLTSFPALAFAANFESTHIKLNSFSFQTWQSPGSNQGSRFSFLHTFICTSESGFQVPKHPSPSSLDMLTYLLVLIVLKRNGLSSPLFGGTLLLFIGPPLCSQLRRYTSPSMVSWWYQ